MFNSLSRREVPPDHFLRLRLSGSGRLVGQAARSATARAASAGPEEPHFTTPRAKRVIFMFMQGGPSHVDTFDYKPALEQDDGKSPGEGSGAKANRKLMKSPWKFSPAGRAA